MGIAIKIDGVTFTKYIGVLDITDDEPIVPDTYPVTDTLKGLYYFGGTVDDCLTDQSGNGNNATLVGSITAAEGYATFTGTGTVNRVDTPVYISSESKITAVAMFRVPEGLRSIVANFRDGNDNGFIFTNDRVFTLINGSVVNKVFTTINSENFAICALSIDSDSIRVVKDGNGSLAELLNYADGGINAWTREITIGGYRSNVSTNDTADIAFVSIHDGDVTDEQLQQIFAYVRAYGENNGLTIE